MLDPRFIFLGVLFILIGDFSYIADTLKGKVKPHKVSYLMWSFPPLIAFAAELKQGVGLVSLMTLTIGLMPMLILLAAFSNKDAYWKISKFDVMCGFLSFIGLILWYLTKDPNIAIIFGILADGFAALPTIIKSYYYPETESMFAYWAVGMGAVVTLLTINTWNFAHYGFPIYYLLVNMIIALLIKYKPGVRS